MYANTCSTIQLPAQTSSSGTILEEIKQSEICFSIKFHPLPDYLEFISAIHLSHIRVTDYALSCNNYDQCL